MARWDVQVLGVDQGRPAATVLAEAARHLGAEPSQIERLLAHAPTALVVDLDEDAAKRLVAELRAIGLRVKPRPAGAEPAASSRPAPAPARESAAVVDERATAPTVALAVPATREQGFSLAHAQSGGGGGGARSSLEDMYEASRSDAGGSGLELEDVALPRPRVSARPAAPASVPPPSPAIAAPVPAAAASPSAPDRDEAPREFWSALPSAFLVPLRTPVLPGLLSAPLCVGIAVLATIFGTFTSAVLVLVLMGAFLGITLQVAHRCLWATAVGERMPASLPTDFLSEYAFPGLGVMVLLGILSGLAGWGAAGMMAAGVPMFVVQLGALLYSLYVVIGFALSAASRSAIGYLDVPRIARILVKAPVPVVVIALIGALVQGGAAAIAGMQLAAVVAGGAGLGGTLVASAAAVYVISLAAAYGAALSATMMGMLFWARPDVAG